MTPDYEVTHNEDGTFSISLPDGDELRIVPPKKEWVGLTDEEIKEIVCASKKPVPEDLKFMEDAVVEELTPLAKSLEAKLKEKNT